MRKHLLGAGATLALLLSACGSPAASSASPAAGACSRGAHHAYLVVQHLDGGSLQRCVGFDGDQIGGEDLMRRSGIRYETQDFSFGRAVCALDQEPAHFDQCFKQGDPYWGLWIWSGGVYKSSETGYTAVQLHADEGLGWHRVPASGTPLPPPAPRK